MQRQVRALFVHDADGRITATRDGEPPPRLFLGLTRHGNLWRFRADLDPERVRRLARLAAAEPAPTQLDALPERHAAWVAQLAADAPLEATFHGAAFRFPETVPDLEGAEELAPGDRDRIAEEFPELAARLSGCLPCFVCTEGGRVVSACWSAARRSPAIEAGVATLPGFRGRGLATRATATWARSVRARGEAPLYSTALSNRAALGVARRLGLIRYGTDLHMR